MKQKIRRSTISFKCDGDSESHERVLCVLLIAAENFQINLFKTKRRLLYLKTVAYTGIFSGRGEVQQVQLRTEERENEV
jgi:hypothetical protein